MASGFWLCENSKLKCYARSSGQQWKMMEAAATSTVTVTAPERWRRRVAERRAAIERAIARLPAIAHLHGGRFLVFGSVAKGATTPFSDLDLLADFPPNRADAAIDAAEEACALESVPCDILDMGDAEGLQPLLDRCLPGAKEVR